MKSAEQQRDQANGRVAVLNLEQQCTHTEVRGSVGQGRKRAHLGAGSRRRLCELQTETETAEQSARKQDTALEMVITTHNERHEKKEKFETSSCKPHGRQRWCRDEAEGATSPLVASPRAVGGRDGACCGPAPQSWCGAFAAHHD